MQHTNAPPGEGLWVGEEMSPLGLPALQAPLKNPAPQAHPRGAHAERWANSQFKGWFWDFNIALPRTTKTITSTSLETSLELELWSLFLPSGFTTWRR